MHTVLSFSFCLKTQGQSKKQGVGEYKMQSSGKKKEKVSYEHMKAAV